MEDTAAIIGQLPGRTPAAQPVRGSTPPNGIWCRPTRWPRHISLQASQFVNRAMRPLRRLERAQWEAAVAAVRSPVASPATGAGGAAVALAIPRTPAGGAVLANLVPSGDFEDFDSMMQSGWQRFQHKTPGLEAAAELVPRAAHGGRCGLCLTLRRIAKRPRQSPRQSPPAPPPQRPRRSSRRRCG